MPMPDFVYADLVTEESLLHTVLDGLKRLGWLTYHTRYSIRSAPGFPDIVAVKPPWVLFIELKTTKGKVSPKQVEWLSVLRQTNRSAAFLLRPQHLDAFFAAISHLREGSETPAGIVALEDLSGR